MEFFYINICGVISSYEFLYETRILDNTYLRFEVQFPTSDSTKITSGGPEIISGGPAPLDVPAAEKFLYPK